LAELFGTPVSEGTVAAMTRRASEGLEEFLTEVTDRIVGAVGRRLRVHVEFVEDVLPVLDAQPPRPLSAGIVRRHARCRRSVLRR
jgi:hypothetical protein